MGDIITDRSVAARRRITQLAFLVKQRHRHAIHFRLDHDRDFLVRQQPLEPAVKIFHLLFRVSVVEAEHRDPVSDLAESFQRLAADALGGGMRRRQFREPFFEIAQLTVKRVVFAIADRWRRFFVIAAIMLLDLAP